MRIALIFPPGADPALPYASLPYLAAALKRAGITDVLQKDVNLQAFRMFLTRANLERALVSAARKLRASHSRSPSSVKRAQASRAVKMGSYLAEHIEEALAVLRSPTDFYDPRKFCWAKMVFRYSCELVSAASDAVRFGKYSYSTHPLGSFAEISDAVMNADNSLLLNFYLGEVLPELRRYAPGLVGISIPYLEQLVPALLLAKLVREELPDCHVTTGGPIVSWGKEVMLANPAFGKFMNSTFVGEADTAIVKLVQALEGRGAMEKVPNMILYQAGGILSSAEPTFVEDLDSLPVPSYEDLPLGDYLAPKRVICLSITRGCYYNRCTFCNYSFTKLGPYRRRSPELAVEDIRTIQERTGEDVFCLESDVVAVDDLRDFARTLIERDVHIKWHSVLRFEPEIDREFCELLSRAGCVRLYAGLESASQRMLNLMDKGTKISTIERIMGDFAAADIALEAGVFFGFPGETKTEARETLSFFKRNRERIVRSDAGIFRLLKGSPVSKSPEQYGIIVTSRADECWFVLSYHGGEGDPKTRQEARKAVKQLELLYPHAKFVDIPEEILLLARGGKAGLANIRLRTEVCVPDVEALLESKIRPSTLLFFPLGKVRRLTSSSEMRAFDFARDEERRLSPVETALILRSDGRRTLGEILRGLAGASRAARSRSVPTGRIRYAAQRLLASGVLEIAR